jgi:hypothetical protein
MSETPVPPEAPTRVRLSDPGEVVAAVPALLGFPPRSSLVALSLRGRRARVGLCLRVDLPSGDDVARVAEQVAGHLVRDGAAATVLVLYVPADVGTRAGPGAGPDAAVADACVQACARAEVEVRDALRVTGGRWWSYRCGEAGCCPPEGSPVPPSAESPVTVAAVAEGRALWPDRDDAVAVLTPPEERDAARMRGVCAEAGATGAEEGDGAAGRGAARATGTGPSARRTAAGLRRVSGLLDRLGDPRTTVSDAEVAAVARLLADRTVRDEVALWAPGERGARLSRLLVTVVQRVPSPYDLEAAATLACVAHQRGEGVLARAAVERALLTDPAHRLTRLVEAALDAGVPPSALKAAAGRAVSPRGRGGRAGARP